VFALGAFGTGIAYVLCYGLIRLAGATLTSTVTYFIPIVSIVIGVVGLGEVLAWNAPVGAAVIIAGAVLSRDQSPIAFMTSRLARRPSNS
jgi:drug/metabolite transporter (DMT)-like permease